MGIMIFSNELFLSLYVFEIKLQNSSKFKNIILIRMRLTKMVMSDRNCYSNQKVYRTHKHQYVPVRLRNTLLVTMHIWWPNKCLRACKR